MTWGVRVLRTHWSFALTLVAATACAPARPAAPSAPPPPPAFVYTPATESYLFVSRGTTEQQMPTGEAASTTYGFTIGLTSAVVAAADSALAATITVDSVPVLSGAASLVAGNIERAVGRSVRGRLHPTGRLAAEPVTDAALGALPQVATLLAEFFPTIPAQGLRAGDRWTDTSTTETHSNGLDIVIDAVRDYEALAWTPWAGESALALQATARYTVSGTGTMSGQPITLSGDGVRAERFYLGTSGAFLGSVIRDSSSAAAQVAALGLSIPVLQTRLDTLRVIR
jgi:hypothetical protein